MTSLKTGIFALATVLGIGSAFTTIPKTPVKTGATTYYAVTNGTGGFFWTTTHPRSSCAQVSTAAYCTIVTNGSGYVPTNNMAPDLTKSTTSDPHSRFNN